MLFAIALLCSGQNATLTGTLAGQIVMEGFLNIRLRPWLRRLITRLIAIIPAIIVLLIYGDRGTGPLLLLSQVVLSLQLPFAVFPLVAFTGNRAKMGRFVAPLVDAGCGVARGIHHCGAQRLAALADVRGWCLGAWRCITHILVPLEHSDADQTIVAYATNLARMTNARILLMHVADGWAARNYDQLALRESEEMKEDRAYLESMAGDVRSQRPSGRLSAGDGRSRVGDRARRRTGTRGPDRHGHAWPPVSRRRHQGRHRRSRAPPLARAGADGASRSVQAATRYRASHSLNRQRPIAASSASGVVHPGVTGTATWLTTDGPTINQTTIQPVAGSTNSISG